MTLLARHVSKSDKGEAGRIGTRDESRAEIWTGGAQLITRLATAGLWLMLAAGPVALALVVATSLAATQPTPAAPVTDVPDDGTRATVEEFAQRFVVDWLQTPRGREERLEAYGLLDLETRQPEVAQVASFPAVARAAEIEPGLWSVTVGVTVTDADPAAAGAEQQESPESTDDPAPGDRTESDESADTATPAPTRQYFQVSVEYRDGLLAAQTLPAAVAAPPVAGHSELVYDEAVDVNDPLGKAAAGFLSALLAGGGDVESYTAADSDITTVASQPFLEIDVVRVRTDDAPDPDVQPEYGRQIHALVTAVALTHARHEVTLQYPLTLTARPGRWEVAEIAPAARRGNTEL